MSAFNSYRNISSATAGSLKDALERGVILSVRGNEIRELRNRVTVISRPWERCLFVPERGNDIFATLAETFWVISGRNDVEWLGRYLPRAADFSDDGKVWRAAYGPRLRNWNGVDQFKQVRDLFLEETQTRRAVMSLFDPGSDFVESKDIPCNNWLHWLNRENRLHLNIGVRSNDIVWGFSGVNSFTWSVLHEMMALWTGAEMGEMTFFASSFHLYKHHYGMAEKAAAEFNGVTCYDYGIGPIKIQTPLENLGKAFDQWFALEANLCERNAEEFGECGSLEDEFFRVALDIFRIRQGVKTGWSDSLLTSELGKLPVCDLTAAAYEFFVRKRAHLIPEIFDSKMKQFITDYYEGRQRDIIPN